MQKTADLSGRTFGRLTVLSRSALGAKHAAWNCRCECGTEKVIRGEHLNRGRIVSCGCHMRTCATTHGHYKSPEYFVWDRMWQRCTNDKEPGYTNYGGRGITVDPAWKKFEQFYTDMGRRPTSAHSIDRKDNDGPYAPWNCRWATRTEQSRNKRSNRLLTFQGETLTLTDWAIRIGIRRATLEQRVVDSKWPIEKALTTPVHGVPHPSS